MSARGYAGGELEAEVDHLGVVADGEVHAFGDRRRFAFALAVEHPHGHEAGGERQAGHAVVVVGGLGDCRGHERAVAVAVVGVGVFGDEVIAFDERVGAEAGRAAEGAAVGVGDAGVEHSDDHPLPAGGAIGSDVGPGFGRVNPELADEVPLQFPPVAGFVAAAFVVRDPAVGDVRDVVGHGPLHAPLRAHAAKRCRDAHAGGKAQQPGVGARHLSGRSGDAGGDGRRGRSRGGVSDDDLVGRVARAGGGAGRRHVCAECRQGGPNQRQDRDPASEQAEGWAAGGGEHGVW